MIGYVSDCMAYGILDRRTTRGEFSCGRFGTSMEYQYSPGGDGVLQLCKHTDPVNELKEGPELWIGERDSPQIQEGMGWEGANRMLMEET